FYKQLLHKEASPEHVVLVGRIGVIILAILAWLLAMNPDSSVLGLVSYAWGGFGAAFGPVILLSLFWKRMNRNGALAGILVGALTVVIWKQLSGGIFDLYELVPGFILATVAVIVVSLLSDEPSMKVQNGFVEYKKNLIEFN
ncbi:MAG: sodium:proline symporter, partial [Psychromonas sp.]